MPHSVHDTHPSGQQWPTVINEHSSCHHHATCNTLIDIKMSQSLLFHDGIFTQCPLNSTLPYTNHPGREMDLIIPNQQLELMATHTPGLLPNVESIYSSLLICSVILTLNLRKLWSCSKVWKLVNFGFALMYKCFWLTHILNAIGLCAISWPISDPLIARMFRNLLNAKLFDVNLWYHSYN